MNAIEEEKDRRALLNAIYCFFNFFWEQKTYFKLISNKWYKVKYEYRYKCVFSLDSLDI